VSTLLCAGVYAFLARLSFSIPIFMAMNPFFPAFARVRFLLLVGTSVGQAVEALDPDLKGVIVQHREEPKHDQNLTYRG
jgi:hypothetical protein